MLRSSPPMHGWGSALSAGWSCAVVGFVPILWASVAFSTPPLAWDPASTAVVASFRERPGEIADADPGPSIQLFGDGRLAVHFPRTMKRAGEWTDRLSRAEMAHLLGALVDDGRLDLDPDALRGRLVRARSARRAAALHGDATLFEASDPSITEVTVRANGRARTIVWRGARADAWANPDVAEVQHLERAHGRLRALADRPGLRRVP